MALSNTAVPRYYGKFRDAVIRGEIPVNESIPLGELKKLSEERMLIFDEEIMTFAMGNCITLEDTNGNRKLYKRKREHKIDCVAAMMDAFVAWKEHKEEFE